MAKRRREHLKEVKDRSRIDELFSGKIERPIKKTKRARTKKRPAEKLPGALEVLGDVYAAGKRVQKELDFKVRYAEQRVKDYCLRRFCEIFAKSGTRPPSIEYSSKQAHFTYIQTSRIRLTHEKVEALREMGVPIDRHTELRGIDVNYEAIRHHRLEKKLQSALSGMGLPEEVLEECFVPRVEPKENFFEVLDNVVKESLDKGEDLTEKLYEVMKVLGAPAQVRNPAIPDLNANECFELVMETEIEAGEEIEEVA